MRVQGEDKLKLDRYLKLKLPLLAVFLAFIVLGVNDYPIIRLLVKIICTSCIGLG